jgi:hypothetical protein
MLGYVTDKIAALSPFLLLLAWCAFLPVIETVRLFADIGDPGLYRIAFLFGSYGIFPLVALFALVDGILQLKRRERRFTAMLNLIAAAVAASGLIFMIFMGSSLLLS